MPVLGERTMVNQQGCQEPKELGGVGELVHGISTLDLKKQNSTSLKSEQEKKARHNQSNNSWITCQENITISHSHSFHGSTQTFESFGDTGISFGRSPSEPCLMETSRFRNPWKFIVLQLLDAFEDFEDLSLPRPLSKHALSDYEYRLESRRLYHDIMNRVEFHIRQHRHRFAASPWRKVAVHLYHEMQKMETIDRHITSHQENREQQQYLQNEVRKDISYEILSLLENDVEDWQDHDEHQLKRNEFKEKMKILRTDSCHEIMCEGCIPPYENEWDSDEDDEDLDSSSSYSSS